MIVQSAPWPDALERMVNQLEHRPGWCISLVADYPRDEVDGEIVGHGTTLVVDIVCPNAYDHEQMRRVRHLFIVPAATYDERSWQRWLLEQLLLVDRHEACEYFTVDGDHPYAPSHGPGNDPYLIREIGTDLDRRTAFTGEVNDG